MLFYGSVVMVVVYLLWVNESQLKKVKVEIEEASNNPQGLILEAIHSASYSGPLAISLMATEAAINRLDGTILEEFVVVRSSSSLMVA